MRQRSSLPVSLLPAAVILIVALLFAFLYTPTVYAQQKQLRPNLNTAKPVTINTALRINLLYNVDSKEETFQLDLFVNEYWVDPKLAFNNSVWKFNDTIRIPSRYTPWLPDTFFFNALKCQTIVDQALTLNPDGTVFWSRHQSCIFHSSFDLLSFPFDSQILAVRRTSFSYTDNELVLNFLTYSGWRPDPQYDFTNSLWDFQYAFSNQSSLQFINTHSANAYLAVSRKSVSYILKMILPMFMLTLLSTVSYAVDPAAPPARVAFSVSLILSIVTFNLVVSQDLPKINYATLIDWYVWYCFLFVVSALGEFAWVNNLLVSKKYGPEFPYLVDDFAMWTAPYTWIILNLYYWPLYNSPAIHIILTMAWCAWIAMNLYRVFYWNLRNKKRGLWEPTKRFYYYVQEQWHKYRHPELYQELEADNEPEPDVDENKQAIELAQHAQGVNVFDTPVASTTAGAATSPVAAGTVSSPVAEFSPSPPAASASPSNPSVSSEPNPFEDRPLLDPTHDSALEMSSSSQPPVDEENVDAEYSDQAYQPAPQDEEEEYAPPEQGSNDLNLV